MIQGEEERLKRKSAEKLWLARGVQQEVTIWGKKGHNTRAKTEIQLMLVCRFEQAILARGHALRLVGGGCITVCVQATRRTWALTRSLSFTRHRFRVNTQINAPY